MLYKLLRLEAVTQGKEQYHYFAVPNKKAQEYYDDPMLAFKSIDAKLLYIISSTEYNTSPDYHNNEAFDSLDSLNAYWQNALVGSVESNY